MTAQLVPCGEFSPGIGGDFERECARRLRDDLPDGFVLATNVMLERGGGSFLECDAVAAGPGAWIVCEMKCIRPRVDVFEDLLRGAGQFAVDRVFSTLDLKAKVLRARREKSPFPSSEIHTGNRVKTLVIVPNEAQIKFHHSPHADNQSVVTLDAAVQRLRTVANESPHFANTTARRELSKGWESYCQASAPGEARNSKQLGRFRVRKQLPSRSRLALEFHATDEPPSSADVRLREFPLDPAIPAQELDAELTRLAREMTVLRKIRHPYVACVTGHFQTGCSWVEVSDWFDGQPLDELWTSMRDASSLERAGIFLKVVAALEYLPRKRSVSPQPVRECRVGQC